MLYEPSYMYPYNTDIDVTKTNTFTCILNASGGTKIRSYQVSIKNPSYVDIYTPSKQTLTTPLYNGDSLEIEIPRNELINGQSGPYCQ